MELKKLKSIEFSCKVYMEYSSLSQSVPIGVRKNTMDVYSYTDVPEFIEWILEDPNGQEEDMVENIGLWFDGKKLSDYDGVFDMPPQAIELLESMGYDMSYCKDEIESN